MYRNVSLKMDKIFPKYYITYLGVCKFFNNGYLFSYDAVFFGHPVWGKQNFSLQSFIRKLKGIEKGKVIGDFNGFKSQQRIAQEVSEATRNIDIVLELV